MIETNLNPPLTSDPVVEAIPPKPKRSLILGILILFLLVGSGTLAAYFYQQNQILKNQLITQTPNPSASPTIAAPTPTSVVPVTTTETTRFGQITWFEIPKPISPLTIFKVGTTGFYGDRVNQGKFFQVADFSDGSKLIMVQLPYEGPSSDYNQLHLVQSTTGDISYLQVYVDSWFIETLKPIFVPGIYPIDMTLSGLDAPDVITHSGQYFNKLYSSGKLFSSLINPVKLFDSVHGPVYQTTKEKIIADLPEFFGKEFYLRLKDNSIVKYEFSDSAQTSKTTTSPIIIWSDSSQNSPNYHQNIVISCAAGGVGTPFVKSDSSLLLGKVQVGKTNKDQPVYQIMDPNNSLVKHLYNNYQQGRDYPSAPPVISVDDFANKHNHYFWQDSMGDWQIFISPDYSPMAECGKPVIYLYPPKDTLITVKVAADITKSEPLYPTSGWTVLAHPNGQLEYQSKTYPNLFWEGTGHGVYPDLKNHGFVVPQSELVSTLQSHLKQLGLTIRESADFMEFWTEKLPSTPYVRLTWLNTSDMNHLAPLQVFPAPNTTIRVFLDFAGLDKPVKLTPQILTAPERQGFTLVEWGGLLIR